MALPSPPDGQVLDPEKVNVNLVGTDETQTLGRVNEAGDCADHAGWHYDDLLEPTMVELCPASCDRAHELVTGPGTALQVEFGCQSLLI